jgi:hypothetical protein
MGQSNTKSYRIVQQFQSGLDKNATTHNPDDAESVNTRTKLLGIRQTAGHLAFLQKKENPTRDH